MSFWVYVTFRCLVKHKVSDNSDKLVCFLFVKKRTIQTMAGRFQFKSLLGLLRQFLKSVSVPTVLLGTAAVGISQDKWKPNENEKGID